MKKPLTCAECKFVGNHFMMGTDVNYCKITEKLVYPFIRELDCPLDRLKEYED
jgi:hypothetical protein